MAPRDLLKRTELFSLAVFPFCRQLPKTAEAQARIFAASVATARKNSRRWKAHPNS